MMTSEPKNKINSGSKLENLANELIDSIASPAPTLSIDFTTRLDNNKIYYF